MPFCTANVAFDPKRTSSMDSISEKPIGGRSIVAKSLGMVHASYCVTSTQDSTHRGASFGLSSGSRPRGSWAWRQDGYLVRRGRHPAERERRVGGLLLNMGRSKDGDLVRCDWKAHQFKGWKLRSRRTGCVQHGSCDGCDREQAFHDKPPLRVVVRQLPATYLLSPTHEVSLFTVVASIYSKVTRPLADIPIASLVPAFGGKADIAIALQNVRL
jgi:hypothetical protein